MGDVIQLRRQRKCRAATGASGSIRSLLPIGFFALVLVAAGALGSYLGTDKFSWKVADPRLPLVSAAATGRTITGRASVIDGDTIEIHGERIRFKGIDAPESSQTCSDASGKPYRCGAKSAAALDEFLRASSPTRCEFVERDRYGRFAGNCYRADGSSVQELLVRSGWALDWPRYSHGAYEEQQRAAQAERRGIWAGTFQPPWEWRAAGGSKKKKETPAQLIPLVNSNASQQSGPCRIKGNINSKGERIYHMPGQQHYNRSKISASKGERWFCSESEARAAGWRPARR